MHFRRGLTSMGITILRVEACALVISRGKNFWRRATEV